MVFDISQVGLWFYYILIDFELSCLICVLGIQKLYHLPAISPSLFSPLSLTVLIRFSQEWCASLTTMAVDRCCQTQVMRAWRVPGWSQACMPCVWSWPEMSQGWECGGLRVAKHSLLSPVLRARPHRASRAVSLIAWAAGYTWHSVRDVPRSDPSVSWGPLFHYAHLAKNNFWLYRFFFIVCLLFISLISALFNFLLISLDLFVL